MKNLSPVLLLTALLAGGTQSASAKIQVDTNPELFLLIWDQTNKVAYTKDLGIFAKTFWVEAQQNSGMNRVIDIDPATDSYFQTFRSASPDKSKQVWAILGGGDKEGNILAPGDVVFFTTLRQGSANGVLNPDWQRLTSLTNSIEGAGGNVGRMNEFITEFNDLSVAGSHSSVENGSGFSSDNFAIPAYPGKSGSSFTKGPLMAGSGAEPGEYFYNYRPFNAVGKSSWFYRGTSPAEEENAPYAWDEFDNGNGKAGNDGYWGLDLNAAGTKYVLTYTLAPFGPAALANTVEGRQRLLTTDYAAGAGASRTLDTPLNEFAGWEAGALSPLSAVPEPSQWLLMGLGLVGLGAVARRRQRG